MTNDNVFFTGNDDVQEKPVIIIDEKPGPSDSLPEGETPTITIEHGEDETPESPKPSHRWLWFVIGAIAAAAICVIAIVGYKYQHRNNLGIQISTSCEENIQNLQRPIDKKIKSEVVMTSDSVFGVQFNLYELKGLKASISFTEPSESDKHVYLYSRCADVDKANEIIGSFVNDGKDMQSDTHRLGYCAMANGNVVIGISPSDSVKDYVIQRDGSFFRQFILVSKYATPPTFYLHGKVERRAIGHLKSDSKDGLYYIESVNPESMYDFADALAAYGFEDAIYITGGKAYSYYRTADGQAHAIGEVPVSKHKGHRGKIPFVVFKKR